MKYRCLWLLLISLMFIVGISESAIAGEFGPFQGKIVDADTKEPIEGVVVLIEWRETHFWAGSTFIDAQETLTDKDGKFYIPGIWVLNPWKRLNIRSILIIYKSGYGTPSGMGIYDRAAEVFRDDGRQGDYIWKFEHGNPVFVLKKMTVEERKKRLISDPAAGSTPDEQKKLLLQEIKKDYEFKYPSGR